MGERIKATADPFEHLPRRSFFADVVPDTKPVALNSDPVGTKPRGAKSARGCPSSGEPWVAAGVSRRTWFRQQKKERG